MAVQPQDVAAALEGVGISPTEELTHRIIRYAELLVLWNQKVSLTSVRRPREILQRHFAESLFAARAVPIEKGRLADVGSGAGFPGLALKLLRPELAVTLIESNLKKTVFLAEVVRELALDGVEIRRTRLEEINPEEFAADFVTARAVGDYEALLAWARPVLAGGGELVLWLGGRDAVRLQAAWGWRWREPIAVPGARERVILVGRPS